MRVKRGERGGGRKGGGGGEEGGEGGGMEEMGRPQRNVTDLSPSTIATRNGGALPRGWLIVAHMLLRPSVGIRWVS